MFELLADRVIYQWLSFSPEERLGSALHFFVADTPQIILLLGCAIFIISVIRSYFPAEKIKKILSQRRTIFGNVVAGFIGMLTPFCSCSAVPLFIGFIEAGVPLGVTFSFLIASPMVNEVAVILLFGLFGWKVALLYMVSGMVIAIFTGVVIGKLNLEHLVEQYCKVQSVTGESAELTFQERCQQAIRFTGDLLKNVVPYIIIAIAIGGLIHGYVPNDFVLQYAGIDNFFAVPLVVALGVPLYNSASGMVPIAYALMEKGVPLGTVLAFMMAVSAISFPEMIILRKVLKLKLIIIFASILTVSIIVTGYLFNLLIK